ncbi:rhomboid-related protein 2-like [Sitodiplosis mosellana]|uniref:rhomboid-related protein 2-like n=1 Tax=Sitodiplosis mosellana TaxID=263140 RepID=UPI002444A291|nr:rhomboid-related protein 2-like [Sitodiplosis mosellana]
MSRIKKSCSVDGIALNNRSVQSKEAKLMYQRSVMRSDVETGRIAEMFVKNEHNQNMREFFAMMDTNKDGVVSIRTLQSFLNYLEPKLGRHIMTQIQKKYGENSDEKLNFEEFLQISVYRINKFQRMVSKYCEIMVVSRININDSMDDLYEDAMSCWPPPVTMIAFSVVQIIIFFISMCYNETGEFKVERDTKLAGVLRYDPCNRMELWRFISYMFIHSNYAHLIGNLVMQICLGFPLELVNHWWRMTLIYLSGVLAGSILYSITSGMKLHGASAGVYALLVSHIATVIMNWKEMYHPYFQLTFFMIYCGADFYRSCIEAQSGIVDGGTAHFAHLGGAVAGLLVGIGVLCNLKQRPWKRKLWFAAVTLFVLLLLAGVCINIFYFDSFVSVECS